MPEFSSGPISQEVHKEVFAGSITLGELPAGSRVLSVAQSLIAGRALVVIATDQGVFVAEPGASRLTKLEPIHVQPTS